MRIVILFLSLAFLAVSPARAGWLDDLLKKAQEVTTAPTAASPVAATLGDEELVRGLKEALAQGAHQAVAQLGKEGGYLNNLKVRIPMPGELQTAERLLRSLGQGKYADDFVATLNQAAERAVPEGTAILMDSIDNLTLADAQAIWKGPDDAATQHFRKTGEARLKERFLPIVRQATDRAGVTAAYKKLMQKAGPYTQLLGRDNTDLDSYVTDRALSGLFTTIAEEERRIRQDPLARGTELLKKVFGAVKK